MKIMNAAAVTYCHLRAAYIAGLGSILKDKRKTTRAVHTSDLHSANKHPVEPASTESIHDCIIDR